MSKEDWFRVIAVTLVFAWVWVVPYSFLRGGFIGYTIMLLVIKFEGRTNGS